MSSGEGNSSHCRKSFIQFCCMVNHSLDPLVVSDDLKPKLLVVLVVFVSLAAGEDDNADGSSSNPEGAEGTDPS